MTFLQLRTFVSVCVTGSVGGAAGELVVTQPSVSAAVAALEREVKTPLLERRGRGVVPTPAGEALLRYAREILALEGQAKEATREAASPGTGRLSIVAVTTAAEYILPPIIERFAAAHPRVEIVLETSNRAAVLDRLSAREADVGIGGRPPAGGPIEGKRFASNDLIVVGAPAMARGLPDATPWILREEGSGTRATTLEFLADHSITPSRTMALGSNGAVTRGAVLGLGLALLPEIAVREELRARRLVQVALAGTPLRRGWYSLVRSKSRVRPSTEAFLDVLLDTASPSQG